MAERKNRITEESLTLGEKPELFMGKVSFREYTNSIIVQGCYFDFDQQFPISGKEEELIFHPFQDLRPEYELIKTQVGKVINIIIFSDEISFIYQVDGRQIVTNVKKSEARLKEESRKRYLI